MSAVAHRCPVCRRPVTKTRAGAIAGHYDTNHTVCPASFRTWDITITDETRPVTP